VVWKVYLGEAIDTGKGIFLGTAGFLQRGNRLRISIIGFVKSLWVIFFGGENF
jgi:hypothetical protein